MTGLATTLWSRVLTGVFLILLVREVFAPARVTAYCGHYVTITNPTHPPEPHSMPVKPASPFGKVPHDLPTPGQAPCHTPSCEGGPALPAAPPVSSRGNTEQEQWDCLLSLPPLHLTDALALMFVAPGLKPRRCPSAIFHPPRLR